MSPSSIPTGGPRSKRSFDLPEMSETKIRRARRILDALRRRHPDAHCELTYANPHQLLLATILSAQATDVGVNKATPELFRRFKEPADYAAATIEEIEPFVKTLNFWRNKAKAIHASMTTITRDHHGEIPQSMEELLELRGVARKTANVVLGNAFGINLGVVVDTHVMRLSRRFGLTEHTDTGKIERDLMALFPRPSWCLLSHLLIFHGRRVCKARGAQCAEDAICRKYCDNAAV
jgi:endonuclease-3